MLFDRFPHIALAEPTGLRRQLTLRGHDRLWVRL
jgi:hypothetical protein